MTTPSSTPKPLINQNSTFDQWCFSAEEIRNCPSARDGMDQAKIEEERQKGCDFIIKVARELKFAQKAIATVVVYFHRFFQIHSFKPFNIYEIGTTCLFLATKVEEVRIPLRDCIMATLWIRHDKKIKPVENSEEFDKLKSKVLHHETLLLKTLCFDLTVEHPYDPILRKCRQLEKTRTLTEEQSQIVAQFAWNFVNDSLSTPIPLQYKAQHIAQAAIYLAAKSKKIPLTWAQLEVEEPFQTIHYDIIDRIVKIYENTKKSPAHGSRTPLPHSSQNSPNIHASSTPTTVNTISSPMKDIDMTPIKPIDSTNSTNSTPLPTPTTSNLTTPTSTNETLISTSTPSNAPSSSSNHNSTHSPNSISNSNNSNSTPNSIRDSQSPGKNQYKSTSSMANSQHRYSLGKIKRKLEPNSDQNSIPITNST